MSWREIHVRYSPESGHRSAQSRCPLSANSRHVTPELFDHFIGLNISTRQTALDGFEARIGFREHARGSFAR
jgi:hypothetical protein